MCHPIHEDATCPSSRVTLPAYDLLITGTALISSENLPKSQSEGLWKEQVRSLSQTKPKLLSGLSMSASDCPVCYPQTKAVSSSWSHTAWSHWCSCLHQEILLSCRLNREHTAKPRLKPPKRWAKAILPSLGCSSQVLCHGWKSDSGWPKLRSYDFF